MEISYKLFAEIQRTIEKLNAPIHVLCILGSLSDDPGDEEKEDLMVCLKDWNDGVEMEIIAETPIHKIDRLGLNDTNSN